MAITYEISITCDGCKATFTTGEAQEDYSTVETINEAWQKGWRFPRVDNPEAPNKHYCPECADKNMRKAVEAWEQSVKADPPKRVV